MAYSTGVAVGGTGVLSSLSSFLTGNGWTLHDDLGDHDKVFKSTGTSGKQNHYVRVTLNQKVIDYTSGSGTLAVGNTLTGGTSGATAKIAAFTGGGTAATGSIVVTDIVGTFTTGETLTATGWTCTGPTFATTPIRFGHSLNQYSVRLATTAALAACTPSGTGPGKTLTANANGALSIDGVAVATGDRVLVKNQVSTSDNGIYVVTQPGSGGTPFILTRATDMDSTADVVTANTVYVLAGSTLRMTGWRLTPVASGSTFDSVALVFTLAPGGGFRDPADIHNVFDYLITRCYSYWNAGSHAGVNETGQAGPWAFSPSGATNSTVATNPYTPTTFNATNFIYYFRPEANASSVSTYYTGQSYESTLPDIVSVNTSLGRHDFSWFDGHRFCYGQSSRHTSTLWVTLDMANLKLRAQSADGLAAGTTGFAGNYQGAMGPLVYYKSTDIHEFWSWNNSGTLANMLKRWASDTQTWNSVTTPGALLPLIGLGHAIAGVWDGRDKIYFLGGNTGTTAAVYNIGAATWTNIASPNPPPAGVASNGGPGMRGIYIPAGNIPGITEDIVLWWSRVSTAVMTRYNVTSGTWTTVTAPEALVDGTPGCGAVWDSASNVLYVRSAAVARGDVYVINLQDGLSFTPTTTRQAFSGALAAALSPAGLLWANHFVSKLRVRGGDSITYRFVGDADSVVVTSTLSSGRTYWIGFGLSDTRRATQIATLSAPATAGSSATITVDDTTGFNVGDTVTIVDLADGHTQVTKLSAIPSATEFTAPLTRNVASGARVSVDACHCMVTGDSRQAVFISDAKGVRADAQASHYRVTPLASPDYRAGVDARGTTDLWPLVVRETVESLGTYENRSTLRGIYVAGTGVHPSTTTGSVITSPTGDEYLVISAEHDRLSPDPRQLAIGPI